MGTVPHSIGLLVGSLSAFILCEVWRPMTAFVSDAVPPGAMDKTFALANSMWQVGALAAPSLGGLTRNLTGSFREGCYLTGAVLGTAAAVIVGVFAPRDSGFFRAGRERGSSGF